MKELGIKFTNYEEKEYPENIGKRTKFGGTPEWIQNKEDIQCKSCKSEMSFVSQVDSFDFTGEINENKEFMFGDCGMIYIFFCFDCNITKSYFQEY
ncbi:DUF1963 domain-containing protein [Tenacibaculum piscium]|uniref:DUF1963 domain-containing protein n=1 Tax=Tenacibaculum piscium TaxID=1458515 RepID=UPI00187B4D6D|nr:DUF1963 domain-containing protein [Tenacibaculum piscium]MBE7686613.1 DUF1963 domain-containing protein [Tenacibaculum piscium]